MTEKNEKPVRNYHILLIDKVGSKIVERDHFSTNDEEELTQELIRRQEGYCVTEEEKPECFKTVLTDLKGKYLCLCAESDSDFVHVTPLERVHKVEEPKK
jgi:hypothetical protein